jgi:vacuolar-type H+-ATPase subunit H
VVKMIEVRALQKVRQAELKVQKMIERAQKDAKSAILEAGGKASEEIEFETAKAMMIADEMIKRARDEAKAERARLIAKSKRDIRKLMERATKQREKAVECAIEHIVNGE